MKKIFSISALIMGVLVGMSSNSCGKNQNAKKISYNVGYVNTNFHKIQDMQRIVKTFSEWTVIYADYSTITEFHKYNKQFFTSSSLVVYSFESGSGIASIEITNLCLVNKEIEVTAEIAWQFTDVMSYGFVIMEVLKVDITNANSVRVFTIN